MSTFKIGEDIRHELERFREYMRKQEYTVATVTGYHTYLSRFLRQTGPRRVDSLQEAIKIFLKAERLTHPQTYKYCRAALHLYCIMVTGDVLKSDPGASPMLEITPLLQRFRDYSLEVKHLEASTTVSEISHVRGFLEYALTSGTRDLVNGLRAEDVRGYVTQRLTTLADSSKGRMITSIRNFFRCQKFYGEPVHPSILQLPLSPAVWKKSAFPTTISMGAFNALHTIPEEDTEIGKRNRCIILCFTELALRCSEVAALTLDDFNWRAGCVTIRNTKTQAQRALPLPETLGNALLEYLVRTRPQTMCRTLFVRFSHMRGEAMNRGQIRGIVRRNGLRAGLEDRLSGTHILRRTAATKLYNSGNSLKLTADVLGHKCLDSTTHYAKTDVAGLLSVASCWPGGENDVE